MSEAAQNWDVIVVGAGLAGLRAALDLNEAGKRVLVLEARDRVGGRPMAGQIQGRTVDFGGQWLGATHSLMREQAQALGVAAYPQFTDGATLIGAEGRVVRYTSGIVNLPVLSLLSLGLLRHRWSRDLAALPPGAPWSAARAREWDAQSVGAWIDDNVHTATARDFARLVVGAITCADDPQISYLYFLDCLRQGGGLDAMMGVQGGSQQDKFVGGAWSVSKAMAEKLGDIVRLGTPVSAIEQDGEKVHVETPAGRLSSSRLVMTVPPPLSSRIRFSPALPPRRMALLQRMPMGSVIKLHVAYETPFWRRNGLNGTVGGTDRALGLVFDQSPPDDDIGILVGLIVGGRAVEFSALDRDERKTRVVSDLVHYFGAEASEPLEYVDHDWCSDEWTLGGYSTHMPPGIVTAFAEVIRERCGLIHWAGTETAVEYMGYFEGALRSGVRVAREILQAE